MGIEITIVSIQINPENTPIIDKERIILGVRRSL